MTRWILPFLAFLVTAAGAWHATIAVTTFGLMEAAVRRLSARSGFNTMSYGSLATPDNQPIVRPSPDLAYSSCPYDLSNGPLLINYVPVVGRYSSLSVFDAPEGFSSCTRRIRSNTPLQALTLLNDASCFEFAQALEKIIKRDGITTAFRRCVSREPAADELVRLGKLDSLTAARVLLNLDETITRE